MLKREWIRVFADRSLATLLVVGWGWHAFRLIFSRLEWYDWVAYALPAANWIERGVLSTPQLGPQFRFDRTWLFNAPLMGAGPAPLFGLLGTGRVEYLVGVVAFAVANLAAFRWVIGRALKTRSVALSVFCALAVVEHRVYLSFYANQRYDLIAFAALLLAFAPRAAGAAAMPAWSWACAGILPLLHPSLLPASVVWLAVWAVSSWRQRNAGADVARPVRILGPVLFATAWVAAACWYGRPEGLESQFLPHLRFHSVRTAEGSQAGQIFAALSALPFSIPSHATTLLIAGLALGLGGAALARVPGRISLGVAIPAGIIVAVVAMDLLRGFSYWAFYLLGLAPCVLFALGETRRPRQMALGALVILAAAQTAVALRLDRSAVGRFAGQREAVAFLVAHTSPGETLVVGPPFVLAAAPPSLPGGRKVVRVVPQPFYLLEFDRDRYRADVAAHASTYIGSRRWFTQVTIAGGRGLEDVPLFENAALREARFFGEPVVIARRGKEVGPSQVIVRRPAP